MQIIEFELNWKYIFFKNNWSNQISKVDNWAKKSWGHIWCIPQLCENPCKPQQKNYLNSQKKITHVDDMMIHNLVRYLVQTRLRL